MHGWRIFNWRESVSGLKTSVTQKAKHISAQVVRTALGDDVYHTAG